MGGINDIMIICNVLQIIQWLHTYCRLLVILIANSSQCKQVGDANEWAGTIDKCSFHIDLIRIHIQIRCQIP
jgi:hypothetical protein